jgi:hypothetical protein
MLTQTCPPGCAEAYRSAHFMHLVLLQARRRPEARKGDYKSRAKKKNGGKRPQILAYKSECSKKCTVLVRPTHSKSKCLKTKEL